MAEIPVKIGKGRRVKRIVLLFLIFLLVAGISGILIFRDVFRPGQQQRVISILPFMENFLHRVPEDYALPTPRPSTSEISPEDLLNSPFGIPTSSAIN